MCKLNKKVVEVYEHWLPEKLGAVAVVIGHYIFYTDRFDNVPLRLRKHEMKHIEQIDNMGIFWFYVSYFSQYIRGRFHGLGHWEAYENITFEIEATKAEYEIKKKT